VSREVITAALWDRLAAIPGLRTTGRKPKDRDQVSASDCPALFLGVGSSAVVAELGQYPLWRLEFVAYLHVYDGSVAGPSEQLNSYLDAIEAALARGPGDEPGMGTGTATTLGGTVHAARVSSVETDEGSFGDRAVALVTIEVMAAG
jgi:hypothetical protein